MTEEQLDLGALLQIDCRGLYRRELDLGLAVGEQGGRLSGYRVVH